MSFGRDGFFDKCQRELAAHPTSVSYCGTISTAQTDKDGLHRVPRQKNLHGVCWRFLPKAKVQREDGGPENDTLDLHLTEGIDP